MIVKRVIREQEQEYEYKGKPTNYDSNMHIRMSTDALKKIKAMSSYLEYENYTKFVRDVLEKYLDAYKFIEDENGNYIVKEVGR